MKPTLKADDDDDRRTPPAHPLYGPGIAAAILAATAALVVLVP